MTAHTEDRATDRAPYREPGRTTVCVAGGGPAGAVLGLLLARSGIDVVVLEKHGDFLRDFRGDTIHPSTLDVLDEIGLGERFERLDHHKVLGMDVVTDGGEFSVADLGALRGRHPYIAMVPQWDFLTMITQAAADLPGFRLLMKAEATGLLREDGRVTGVRYRDAAGDGHEIRAELTVAADGRHSTLRRAAGLPVRDLGAPMDVAWFRLPREPGDRPNPFLRPGPGRLMAVIDRGTYWQTAYMIPKGGWSRVRARGADALRADVAELVPFFADRLGELDLDRISVLDVRVDRLRRWYRPGLLCIGDAAHAMSPIGGVGINLAVQDAVATANRVVPALRATGTVGTADLAAVQRRRMPPTMAVQAFQQLTQRFVVERVLSGRALPPDALVRASGVPAVQRLLARLVGYGPLPEHVRTPALTWTRPRTPALT
ncbi:FAD-dependent oxidoreductase [Actinomadura logoneensis]|uniref:FAD-dependent oxidoreductase n=1 Tax=Actinomadura logoneensis TaxID=2293572 RepID=A0A372JRN3_9ACTN|nr:FAD-dependent oxidoreductase [Actinomadura logoneensis]RFU42681.1 FAD-dependent oxidoreductase [Actinomadura logoneensis]